MSEDLQSTGVSNVQVADYKRAFLAIEPKMSPSQWDMLIGHAVAPQSTLSMGAIATLAGYDSYASANIHYGRLGRMFAHALGIAKLPNQTMAIAEGRAAADGLGHYTWTLRAPLVQALRELGLVGAEADADVSEACVAGDHATTREAVVLARQGQGVYRQRLLTLWASCCAVTSCAVPDVLVASHAKPWVNSSDEERLDPYNGLLLAASVDRLFDRGLISFDDDGRLLVSSRLDPMELPRLGLNLQSRLRFIEPRHRPYLAAHRSAHGFDNGGCR